MRNENYCEKVRFSATKSLMAKVIVFASPQIAEKGVCGEAVPHFSSMESRTYFAERKRCGEAGEANMISNEINDLLAEKQAFEFPLSTISTSARAALTGALASGREFSAPGQRVRAAVGGSANG